ncbi:rSAM-associated Gly-rich repeat protein [Synechococcus sp. Tobar12-5m-g]|uniref:GrrA/OscA1 family cyclophane-containing rSAM-modified RiPP n=1 Tax=unclassified Synechococcus TaxID=2626047 RepID=UPI0020CD57A7|nr:MULTISPECIES: GrrA/OscA1 family cyclophane-containing rSAM-modified RiPP [unclassified Synechococcus]MCP9771539.1 rSAM-associated Gly-rich repeat protein [Synechococcus sp. Tobar12-5m-g]MCP9872479.1 rSAM-associated Gly-rich repeat protein [Synechococcus sp. Cruz CV-v-12]
MTITSRAGMLGVLISLTVLALPSAWATGTGNPAATGTIEARLSRIATALRERQGGIDGPTPASAHRQGPDQHIAAGFVNGRYGGAVRGPGGGGFVNGHPYYGGASRGFVNGGGGFVNGAYGGGGFLNAAPRGGVFRNW